MRRGQVFDFHNCNPKYRYAHVSKCLCAEHGEIPANKIITVGKIKYCSDCYNAFLQGKKKEISPVEDQSYDVDTWKGREPRIDLRPSGWFCGKHGPLSIRQVVKVEDDTFCLTCFKDDPKNTTMPALKYRKLELLEFEGYNLSDGRFYKSGA